MINRFYKIGSRPSILAIATVISLGLCPGAALAQTATSSAPAAQDNGIGDIIVTAQKRSQSINNVGMSINAITADAMVDRGVKGVEDLASIVPGFTYTPSPTLTPVYSIRGIGFYDLGLSSSPAVSVYVDEIPLAYPVMTPGASLDLERVEVLKGPQGTLFGQNSTGGAINYIAAKPTDTFEAGGTVTYARFGRLDAEGFVSGPVSSTLKARLALRAVEGGAWQYSLTRPGDKLGNDNQIYGRLLLDWQPTDRLKVAVNLNGFRDKSDSLALQTTAYKLGTPSFTDPAVLAQFAAVPIAPNNARAADWSASSPMSGNSRFLQASIRADYEISDAVTLTSISAYSDMKVDRFSDTDGTALSNVDYQQIGRIKDYNQELRLSGQSNRFTWIFGASYQHSDVFDSFPSNIVNSSIIDLFRRPDGSIPPVAVTGTTSQKINNYAAFGNVEYQLTDRLTLQGGLRYTDSRRKGIDCALDTSGSNSVNNAFTNILQPLLGIDPSDVTQINPGQCYALDLTTARPQLDGTLISLNEDNISWRAGLNYKFDGGTLLYANLSRGYKAGAIPLLNPSFTQSYSPAVQERVDAYEIGFKAPFLDRKAHLNAAAFYYDYKNKQVRGSINDANFGNLEKLINVPKSRVWGLEADLQAEPVKGLELNGGITYVNSKVNGTFLAFNREVGGLGDFDFKGSPLPYTPKVTGNADIQYQWNLRSGVKPFLGASVVYHGKDNSTFRSAARPATDFAMKAYALLDLRAGVAAEDDSWRVTLFGRNVTNTFYWTGVTQAIDFYARSAGRPATYGITVSVRTR